MARSVPPALYDQIVTEIAKHPGGVGIAEIAAAFPALPRRTLQRHLARLVTDDRIRGEGQAVARRYLPVVARVGDAAVVESQGGTHLDSLYRERSVKHGCHPWDLEPLAREESTGWDT